MPKASPTYTPSTPRRAIRLAYAAPALIVPVHPDATLIRICAEHAINHHAFETHDPDLEDEDNPLYFAFLRTEAAIDTAMPVTMEGVIAKARIAKIVATTRIGTLRPTDSQGAQWGWDIVQDLLRLNGAPA